MKKKVYSHDAFISVFCWILTKAKVSVVTFIGLAGLEVFAYFTFIGFLLCDRLGCPMSRQHVQIDLVVVEAHYIS